MRRWSFAMVLAAALCAPGAASAAPYTASEAVKINVMGEWAHPDDDTSIIGPCGVWHARYDVKCGIIMVTRGEGGGNATGTELGPALGLRRENEDRVAHYRSGTVDIFNIDQVDFFYNQSAPLTQYFWGDETLRRITRIIRMTQPDIYVGFTPSLAAGHGNHQQAGRYIWEGMQAAADPTMFPEQLTGPNALSTWQVKKVFSGGATAGTGGTTSAPDCTTGFTPTGLDNVSGVWTGYASPYRWPPGNVQGQPAGTAKTWAQVAMEGTRAYPTQSRVMFKELQAPGCSRFGMTGNFVPFQPNVNPDGSLNAAAGKDDAILYGAVKPDPGGLPLGTLQYLTFSDFYNTPGGPFQATVHLKAPSGTIPAGSVALNVPAGWTVDAAKPVPAVGTGGQTVTFTVTPSATAAVNTNYKVSATWTAGGAKGYTDQVVRVVSPVEGLFQRWGKFAEYDQWTEETAPLARRIGRSGAVQTTAAGETFTLPVKVHNWSDEPQSGEVRLTLPAGLAADATSKPYATLAPGAETTVNFSVSNSFTNATLPTTNPGNPPGQQVNTNVNVRITTTYNGNGTGFEDLTLAIVPKTSIPAGATPTLDGAEGAGEYTGESLDVGKKWEPGGATRDCVPLGVDCGSAGANQTYAKVTRSGDDLYFFIRVQDDFQSYAVTPEECVGHWLADSVEILIDPRGRASENAMDTAHTFKLAVFPFTNDPANRNGNGVNGPCWSRDADNHQGYSTGPLAATIPDGPNAPGVQVKSTATWVGTNDVGTSHAYAGGGYNLEVKVPMAILPAAVDPERMGLNITPYDNDDNTAGTGSTVLRHIDMSTRLAWATFGSVQSDPYRWGRATLPGYTPPAGRPTTPAEPKLASPLDSADSPQTIAQSARNGVPISGREPAPAARGLTITGWTASPGTVDLKVTAGAAGKARLFLYGVDPRDGNKGYTRVWNTSCDPATNPAPDYGLSACSAADGSTPPWAPDMMGGVLASRTFDVAVGASTLSLPISAEAAKRLEKGVSLLVSFVNAQDEVQAFDVPVTVASGTVGGTVPATLSLTLGPAARFDPFTPGITMDYTATTTATVISTAGDATLSVSNPGHMTNGAFTLAEPLRVELEKTTWNEPVSNDEVDVTFRQLIKRTDPLRTGTYSKTVTFTLSTTNP
ncbi:PIG-L family deacetylase [Solirubrobacter sp. CPCC 204708]|uniref:PIG-L family deacetylase n=1 Tax=Solirubrobacter deserti TaxID=2282478 RepID=A0ABT4RGF1_9ACTN|nr:PIG-L family deacetylase [Solirubrobacter deserti]MBE2319676.1 PIG-L family deacetylase [Solirubrobacter deserti]MDA0137585.1 PIG-L family deacetylase [Solirubrobacter deserti]